jgi:hypothetical protein
MKKGKKENLIPLNKRTKEEQREIARKGGKASQKKQREKRLLSQIYADVLADLENLPEGQNLKDIIRVIIKKKKPHSVSMLKEIREATEGSNVKLTGDTDLPISITIKDAERINNRSTTETQADIQQST